MTNPPPQGQNPFSQGQNPYGQQPQGGPYGQQPPQGGYPQQGAPQQGSPYFNQGAPVAPQQPRRGFRQYLRGAALVLGVIVIAGGWWASRDDAQAAAVGDCMHRGSSSTSSPDLEVVDCGDAKAQYKVLAKVDGNYTQMSADAKCKEEAEGFQYSYTQTGDGENFLLCLQDYSK